jgi:hypothetical protein
VCDKKDFSKSMNEFQKDPIKALESGKEKSTGHCLRKEK